MSAVSTFPGRDRSSSLLTVQSIPDIPKQTVLDYLASIGLTAELTEAERTQFVSVCQAFGLNPFKREVYATVYGEGSYRRFSVIVGYETYLKRADRSGKLDGWSSRIEGSGDDMKAIVEIHRRDWSEPLVHEVYFVRGRAEEEGRLAYLLLDEDATLPAQEGLHLPGFPPVLPGRARRASLHL